MYVMFVMVATGGSRNFPNAQIYISKADLR
jgi:hypothetical protein